MMLLMCYCVKRKKKLSYLLFCDDRFITSVKRKISILRELMLGILLGSFGTRDIFTIKGNFNQKQMNRELNRSTEALA